MVKNLYKGMFQFPLKTYIERVMAYSELQAKVVMAQRLAKKQDRLPVEVMSWMKENPDNYEILLEVKYEEEE
jgi:hypothetical protein